MTAISLKGMSVWTDVSFSLCAFRSEFLTALVFYLSRRVDFQGASKSLEEERHVKEFFRRLRLDARLKNSHFVFIAENNLSAVAAGTLDRYISTFGPITALHHKRKDGSMGSYLMTDNNSKLLGYGHLSRIISEQRIHFAKNMVTTNDSVERVKDILADDFDHMKVTVEEKNSPNGTRRTTIISGKPDTDDSVMTLMIGLAYWSLWTLSPDYRSGTRSPLAQMGEIARLSGVAV